MARRFGGTGFASPSGWYSCRCPAHADMAPSLGLKDGPYGRLLFKCFSGCTAALVAEKLKALAAGGSLPPPGPATQTAREPGDSLAWAWGILRATFPSPGTVGETYWGFRGLPLPVPETVRFHPHLFHKPSGRRFPAMVAVVTNPAGEFRGVHRTWLRADGRGKAAVTPSKMSLGHVGGGAVHLGEGGDVLLVAEGIETAMSAAMLLGIPAVWAALSTSGMRSVVIPDSYTEIVIAADNDSNGAGLDAAEALRQRLLVERRKVRILKPKIVGQDFNDVLQSKGDLAA